MSLNLPSTVESRTKLARSLTKFLKENNVEIKHTLANKAIATLLGFNEHSLAAAIGRTTKQSLTSAEKSSHHNCSVASCKNRACASVHLYDIYFIGEEVRVFDEEDFTCPYICSTHLTLNESKAVGERKPRGFVKYPYTNRNGAQGFNIYRSLNKNPFVPELITDYGTGRTMNESLKDLSGSITFLRRVDNTFYIFLGSLKTEISITLSYDDQRIGINFELSHVIKTPIQIGPYRPSRPWGDDPGYALFLAITSLTQYYDDAIKNKHMPEENWLIRN